MPRATRKTESVRFELESCPGGFVDLRQMSWGERLQRQEMAMQMAIDRQTNDLNVQALQVEVTMYEFKSSIVEHNLEDDNGRTLNFSNRADFLNLDPIIAEEIQTNIDSLNTEVTPEQQFPAADGGSQ